MRLDADDVPHPAAAAIRRSAAAVPFLRRHLCNAGIDTDGLRTAAQVATVPFTTKAHLRAGPPEHMWSVPVRSMARLHASSGSTGAPTVCGYTRADLDQWARLTAADLARAGIGPGSIVVNAYPYGLSTGGLGFAAGAELLGATVVPASATEPTDLMVIGGVVAADALLCTPNDATRLLEAAREAGMGPLDLPFRVGVFGGECWSGALRRRLEQGLGVEAYDVYGLSEVIGPGLASECAAHAGLHVASSDFWAEVVDPGSARPCDDGQVGELVITTLRKEAMPLVRYRTGDLASIDRSPCRCGDRGPRIRRLLGRLDDRLDEGTPVSTAVLPVAVEDALLADPALSPFYEIVRRPGGILIRVEVQPGDRADCRQAAATVVERTGLEVTVEVRPPHTIPRRAGKAQRLREQ